MPSAPSSEQYETLLFERKGPAAIITLNRPAAMNALSKAALEELQQVFGIVRSDKGIRGAVITGAGDRAFVAGMDISELAAASWKDAEDIARTGQALCDQVETLGKPVIAAINGVALGGGCELALACTMRLAGPSARFGQPEIKLGIMPGFGGTQRLPRLVGRSSALHLILTGAIIPAAEAYRIGLVNEIVEPAILIARAEAIIAEIAANAPLPVSFCIEAVHQGLDGSQAEGLALERALFTTLAGTEDKAEGTAAFLQKRAAIFKGR